MKTLKFIGKTSMRATIEGKDVVLSPGEVATVDEKNDYIAGLIGQGFFDPEEIKVKKSQVDDSAPKL